jgi:hypothetical protein
MTLKIVCLRKRYTLKYSIRHREVEQDLKPFTLSYFELTRVILRRGLSPEPARELPGGSLGHPD